MPTISETLEIFINGNSRGLVRATVEAESAVGRLQQKIESFREVSKETGEFAHRGYEILERVIETAGEEQVALTRAVGNFKGAISGPELEEWAKGLERITGISHGRIEGLAGELAAFGANPEQAEKLVGPILNVEQALKNTGASAEGVGRQIAIALRTGNVGRLQRVLALDPRTQAQFEAAGEGAEGYTRRLEILLPVLEKMGGTAASDFQKTLPGATMALRTSLETLAGAIGEPAIKPLTDLAHAATDLAHGLEQAPGPVKVLALAAGVGLVGAFWAVSLAAKGAALYNSLLLKRLVETTEGHADAGGAATAQAGEEGNLAKVLTGALTPTTNLAIATERLAQAHRDAAIAAGEQAGASRGIGGGAAVAGGTGAGAVRNAEKVAEAEAKQAAGTTAVAVGAGTVGAAAAAKAAGGAAGKAAAAEFDMSVGKMAAGTAAKKGLGAGAKGLLGRLLGAGAGEVLGAAVQFKDPGSSQAVAGNISAVVNALQLAQQMQQQIAAQPPQPASGMTPGEEAIVAELQKHTQMWKEGRGSVSTSQVPLIRQLAARRVDQFS